MAHHLIQVIIGTHMHGVDYTILDKFINDPNGVDGFYMLHTNDDRYGIYTGSPENGWFGGWIFATEKEARESEKWPPNDPSFQRQMNKGETATFLVSITLSSMNNMELGTDEEVEELLKSNLLMGYLEDGSEVISVHMHGRSA
jgi:hypothetical protein